MKKHRAAKASRVGKKQLRIRIIPAGDLQQTVGGGDTGDGTRCRPGDSGGGGGSLSMHCSC